LYDGFTHYTDVVVPLEESLATIESDFDAAYQNYLDEFSKSNSRLILGAGLAGAGLVIGTLTFLFYETPTNPPVTLALRPYTVAIHLYY